MTTDAKESLRSYLTNVYHYLENAFRFLDQREIEKSGEFIWGSMAAALKALAMSKGIRLKSHRDIWDYARSLAKELESPQIFDDFLKARTVHTNFYESDLRYEDVALIAEETKRTIGRLVSLIPEEMLRELTTDDRESSP